MLKTCNWYFYGQKTQCKNSKYQFPPWKNYYALGLILQYRYTDSSWWAAMNNKNWFKSKCTVSPDNKPSDPRDLGNVMLCYVNRPAHWKVSLQILWSGVSSINMPKHLMDRLTSLPQCITLTLPNRFNINPSGWIRLHASSSLEWLIFCMSCQTYLRGYGKVGHRTTLWRKVGFCCPPTGQFAARLEEHTNCIKYMFSHRILAKVPKSG